mmetsp:Transcript_89045/g.288385  ORF Transcript_89045/g.288385 Transcript_89045/m.288385 type:complete len:259 (-) Transcript_89045:192-968(-)
MAKKIKAKGGSRRKRKRNLKDPLRKSGAELHDSKYDRPPLLDDDIVGEPEVQGGNSMFSLGSVPVVPDDDGLNEDGLPRPTEPEKSSRHAKRKARRKAGLEDGPLGLKDGGRQSGSKESQAIPKQKPGESARAYAKRVEKILKERMQHARRKLSSDRKKEKMKSRTQALKAKLKEKKEQRGNGGSREELQPQAEKPMFGDVVKRPPTLSAAAEKSREKLKSSAAAAAGGRPAADLEAYADKVREAYAALKQRRLDARR